MGGSQGGLLVGGAFTLRPDLFGAVVCQVPLLDMQRFNKLLAGASWMAEYGNPDVPEDWAYIQTWSPYQLVQKGVKYPKVFFWTTTRDDRVHPGHARKMVARMREHGAPGLLLREHRGRPRVGLDECPARPDPRARVQLPVEDGALTARGRGVRRGG